MQEIDKERKYFETQKEEENVLIVARRHWVAYVPSILVALMVYILGLILLLSLGRIDIIEGNEFLKAILIACTSIFLLFITLFAYMSWLIHYLNIQIVTDENVVDIDQPGLFSRKISELRLDDIQDVSATKKGIIQSFLDYGNITIQTAGEKPNFTFKKVPAPHELARSVMNIREKYGDGKRSAENDQVTP